MSTEIKSIERRDLPNILEQANLLFASKNYKDAKEALCEVIYFHNAESAPMFAQRAYVQLATILTQQGELYEAENILKDSLILFPENYALLAKHASLLQRKGDFEEAFSRWDYLRRQYPDQVNPHIQCGNCRLASNMVEEAREIFEGGAKRFEENVQFLYGLARVDFRSARWLNAAQSCQLLQQRFPDFHQALALHANCHLELEDFPKSRVLFETAIQKMPQSRSGYAGLARLARKQREYEDALVLWSDVLLRFPGDAEAIAQKAKIYLILEKYSDARSCYELLTNNTSVPNKAYQQSTERLNILTIGAYERDNFGDLLFFLVLEQALDQYNCNLVSSSITYSDMSMLMGRRVYPYDLLLKNYSWDAVWVVGGEIGNCKIDYALKVALGSLSEGGADTFLEFHEQINHKFEGTELAYLPDVKNYKPNNNTTFIVNSVGGFSHNNYIDSIENVENVLTSADFVSVRDQMSNRFLNALHIENALIPDIVHILPIYHSKKEPPTSGDYILFQINSTLLNRYSIKMVATSLIEIIKKFQIKIFLFAAGTAFLHDDIDDYLKLKSLVNSSFQKDRIELIEERGPFELVDWISNCKLWIGSSLHGRILSIAYSVPRISLCGDKVSEYSELWDEQFPFDVAIEELVPSSEIAFSVPEADMVATAEKLSNSALINLNNIVKKISLKRED